MKLYRKSLSQILSLPALIILVVIQISPIAFAQKPNAFGQNNNALIGLELGQPTIWSLAQAHYLLAEMRHSNRSIRPDALTLNPNSTNGLRVDILRQVFGAEGQFNQAVGAKNRLELDKFEADSSRKQLARARLDERLDERNRVFDEIGRFNKRVLDLEAEQEGIKAIEEGKRSEDQKRRFKEIPEEIKKLNGKKAIKEAQRDALNEEIKALGEESKATVSSPTLGSVLGEGIPTSTSSSTFPFGNDIGTLLNKVFEKPSNGVELNAQTKLDNHIQLQYEIISKQLSLLKDEVGPEQRLVFLEFPASFYTVPKKSKEQLIEIDWTIPKYFGTDPVLKRKLGRHLYEDEESYLNAPPITLEMINELCDVLEMWKEFVHKATPQQLDVWFRAISLLRMVEDAEAQKKDIDREILDAQREIHKLSLTMPQERKAGQAGPSRQKVQEQKAELEGAIIKLQEFKTRAEEIIKSKKDEIKKAMSPAADFNAVVEKPAEADTFEAARVFRATFKPLLENPRLQTMAWIENSTQEKKDRFRTVEIIPRQSALNINATYAKSNGLNLFASFQWLTGIGGKVGYQRQHEIYQQFVHQELYASGYGKGSSRFGWTFAPLPGTDRIAPGVRTTYAVLVIPKDALLLELQAGSSIHKRDQGPLGAVTFPSKNFKLVVPDEQTEGFWVDSVTYTPVLSGERVTVLLTGKYFSPQTGVLVNGDPLSRVLSIGKNEGTVGTTVNGTVVQGEYEYLSSDKIVMTFKMAADYFGTPIITLVTPEKTLAINYFKNLIINFRARQKSLVEVSKTEPMFLRPLELTSLDFLPPDSSGQKRLRLSGNGFRHGGNITINGIRIPDANVDHIDTDAYEITLPLTLFRTVSDAANRINQSGGPATDWEVVYRHHNRQAYVGAVPLTESIQSISGYTITRFSRDPASREAQLELEIAIPDQSKIPSVSVDPKDATATIQSLGNDDYKVTLTVEPGRDNFQLYIIDELNRTSRYVIEMPDIPTIDRVANSATDKEEGPADTEHAVRIIGKNLSHVTEVRFNSSEAAIISAGDDVILVRTPSMEGLARVYLKTSLIVAGVPVTNINDLGRANKAKYLFKK
jgi:hypothetical protein